MPPATRVLLGIGIAFLLFAMGLAGQFGSLFNAIFILLLAFLAGPVMGLQFPFDPIFHLWYGLALLSVPFWIGVGIWKIKHLFGQIAIFVGIFIWGLVGIIGLSTGT